LLIENCCQLRQELTAHFGDLVTETRKLNRLEIGAVKKQHQEVLKGRLADSDTIESRRRAMAEADSVSFTISSMAANGSTSLAVNSGASRSADSLVGQPIRPNDFDRDAWVSYSKALDEQQTLVEELDENQEEAASKELWNDLPPGFRSEIAKLPKRVQRATPSTSHPDDESSIPGGSDGNEDFLVDGTPIGFEIPEALEPDWLNLPNDLLSLYFMQGVLQPILDDRQWAKYKVSSWIPRLTNRLTMFCRWTTTSGHATRKIATIPQTYGEILTVISSA
jgi:hypothetical protein